MRTLILIGLALGGTIRIYAGETVTTPEPDTNAKEPSAASKARQAVEAKAGGAVEFEGTPLEDVIQFLRKVTEINIVIDPAVDRKTPITLHARDMTAENLLKWVVNLAGATYIYKDEAIYIVPKDKRDAETNKEPIRIDVRDLTGSVTNFPGPSFVLGNGSTVITPPDPPDMFPDSRISTKADLERIARQILGEEANRYVFEGHD